MHGGGDAGGFGLQGLGAADFQALDGGGGVEGHVLGFKGSDTVAALGKDPAEGGGY